MPSPTLAEKWGSKDVWLRSLFLRACLIWLFRDELTELQLGRLAWLSSLLENAYTLTKSQASRFDTPEEAFQQAVNAVKRDIAGRISGVGDDAELERLEKIACDARMVDPLELIFACLARNTKRIYRKTQLRRTN